MWESSCAQCLEELTDLSQFEGNIRACRYETVDCASSAQSFTIVLGSVKHIKDKCAFQPKNEHASDANQYPGYKAGGYQKEMVPTDYNNKPVLRKLWNKFHIPAQAPYVYGVFCEQRAWQDKSSDTKVTPLYDGSWRYDNETWVIVRDIATCPCFPVCSECEETLPGTRIKQVKEDGGACLSKYGVKPHQCQNIIVGVSGGPNEYPPETTGYPLDDFGQAQVRTTFKGGCSGNLCLRCLRDFAWVHSCLLPLLVCRSNRESSRVGERE